MRKLFVTFICLFLTIPVFSDNSATSDREMEGVVVLSNSSSPRSKRIPANADIFLIIDSASVTIRFSDDHGLGTYRLYDSVTGVFVCNGVNSSLDDFVSIPFDVTDSSSIDFYIEFEDGSWCHLFWDNN